MNNTFNLIFLQYIKIKIFQKLFVKLYFSDLSYVPIQNLNSKTKRLRKFKFQNGILCN